MSQAVEFPDIIGHLCVWLEDALRANGYPTARVDDVYHGDKAEVWLQRDGGPTLDVVREVARVRVNCFHDLDVEAFTSRVAALLRVAANGAPIVRAEQVGGSTPITDVKPRRLLTFEFTFRGAPLTLA
jgi:hypothetical protein